MQKLILLAFIAITPLFLKAQKSSFFFNTINTDYAGSMCYDAAGNIWLACGAQSEVQLIKINQYGEKLDEVKWSLDLGPNYITQMFMDSEGKLVACGSFTNDFFDSGFAFRFDPVTKLMLWVKVLDDFTQTTSIVELSAGGNYLLLNNVITRNSTALYTLNRNTGNLVPGNVLEFASNDYHLFNKAIAHKGFVYLTTTTSDPLGIKSGSRSGIAKFDPATNKMLWANNTPEDFQANSLSGDFYGRDHIIDNDSLVMLAMGPSSASPATSSIYLQKFDLDGRLAWAKQYSFGNNVARIAEELVAVKDGYLLFGRTGSGSNMSKFLIKTDKDGNLKWARRIGKNWRDAALTTNDKNGEILVANDGFFFLTQSETASNAIPATFLFKTDLIGNINNCDYIALLAVTEMFIPNIKNTPINLSSGAAPSILRTSTNVVRTANPNLKFETLCSDGVTQTVVSLQCPKDITANMPSGASSVSVQYLAATGTTNCNNNILTYKLLQGQPSGGLFPLGVSKVCYEAADACGSTASCCFNVTVQETLSCESKTNGCIRFEAFSIKKDAAGNKRYRFRITNNCNSEINWVAFALPATVTALNMNTVFEAASGRKYDVRNPNQVPFHSVRFKSQSNGPVGGQNDVFEYLLPAKSNQGSIQTQVRLLNGETYQANVSMTDCPIEAAKPTVFNSLVETDAQEDVAEAAVFPNPANAFITIALPESWTQQSTRLEIINVQGQTVQRGDIPAGVTRFDLELEQGLSDGFYLLSLNGANGERQTLRFAVKR